MYLCNSVNMVNSPYLTHQYKIDAKNFSVLSILLSFYVIYVFSLILTLETIHPYNLELLCY